MHYFFSALRGLVLHIFSIIKHVWKSYRAQNLRNQIIIATVILLLLIGLFVVLQGTPTKDANESMRSVKIQNIGTLAGGTHGGNVFGTVRSVSEATILTEASGSVTAVHTTVGSFVGAGFIIAELENDSERASVLQAEGVYDAAVAARNAVSLDETEVSAEAQYRSAFATLDGIVETNIDAFFAGPANSPNLTIDGGGWENSLTSQRSAISIAMDEWRRNLANASAQDPQEILAEASTVNAQISTFLNELARVASRTNSRATSDQLALLASARSSVNNLAETLSSAKSTYQSGSVGATAGADAAVKQALGALRQAQATLEKTRVRAPIAGTVNFLPIRVGDFVSANTHTATVAQNGALEITAYVSEDMRDAFTTGAPVLIEGTHRGVITSIAPALDPITKQIEVRMAVSDENDALVNGASVEIAVDAKQTTEEVANGPLLLPLTAVKLRADDRVVFGVNEEGRLIAYAVGTGDVRADRIEILNDIPRALLIVTDARGLAEGQKVNVVP